MVQLIRWSFFVVGLFMFSLGITLAINVQYLGVHPWDVLTIGLYDLLGFSIGTWNILIGICLVTVTFLLDKKYVKAGTFLNTFMVGIFVDLCLWLDFLPKASHTWTDVLIIVSGIVIMGVGGGLYNAAGVGSGPRDGFMLAIAEKLNAPIRRIRIMTESSVLVIGLIIGGPVFLFTFLFTFIQSPLFQYAYVTFDRFIQQRHVKQRQKIS